MFRAFTRPRYQEGVYKTTGPLVIYVCIWIDCFAEIFTLQYLSLTSIASSFRVYYSKQICMAYPLSNVFSALKVTHFY